MRCTLDTTTTSTSESAGWTNVSFVFSALSLLVLPILLGPVAIILAITGLIKGQPRAVPALIVAFAAPLMGMLIGALVAAASIGY